MRYSLPASFSRTGGINRRWNMRSLSLGVVGIVLIVTLLSMYASTGEELMAGPVFPAVRSAMWKKNVDFELVVSLYRESLADVNATLTTILATLPGTSTYRTIIYWKGSEQDEATLPELEDLLKSTGVHEVVGLPNLGREGETYLQHIVRRYHSLSAPLAKKTFFLQPHIAWADIAIPRINSIRPDTGFISFGPYLNATCDKEGSEIDSHGSRHPRVAQIYSAFNGDFCPPTGFSVTWAGQFLVSKNRIHERPLRLYTNLLEYFSAEESDTDPKGWIWEEQWWGSSRSNPTLGMFWSIKVLQGLVTDDWPSRALTGTVLACDIWVLWTELDDRLCE